MLALAALTCAALFAGAAFYVSFAEHPARMKLDDRAALAQWKPSYDRAALLQASLALLGGVLGVAAWYRWQSNGFWLAGGIVLLLNIPYTLLVIWGTNGALKAMPLDAAGPASRALLVRWGRLHGVRTVLGLAATALLARGILP